MIFFWIPTIWSINRNNLSSPSVVQVPLFLFLEYVLVLVSAEFESVAEILSTCANGTRGPKLDLPILSHLSSSPPPETLLKCQLLRCPAAFPFSVQLFPLNAVLRLFSSCTVEIIWIHGLDHTPEISSSVFTSLGSQLIPAPLCYKQRDWRGEKFKRNWNTIGLIYLPLSPFKTYLSVWKERRDFFRLCYSLMSNILLM